MRYKIQNLFTHIGRTGLNNLFGLIALAFFTVLLSTFLFIHSSVYEELDLKGTVPSLIAWANDTVVEGDARVFADQIQKKNNILYIDYISKEENYHRAEKQFGALGGYIKKSASGSNDFPATLEIYVSPAESSRKKLEEIAFDIESYDEIDDVVLTGQGILTDIFRQTNRMTIATITITILITLLIIRAAVLKTALNRHEEIQLLDIIGATRVHLKIPFFVHGIYLGFCGPVLGLACFYLLYCLLTFQLGVLEFLPYYQLISVVVAGIIIGLCGGIFAQRKYFKSYKKICITGKL